uniref:Uncharacterized protein n=2 Tax=Corvus moneduloides TaxID=1196302 RepID=A0A8U7P879_CORMO
IPIPGGSNPDPADPRPLPPLPPPEGSRAPFGPPGAAPGPQFRVQRFPGPAAAPAGSDSRDPASAGNQVGAPGPRPEPAPSPGIPWIWGFRVCGKSGAAELPWVLPGILPWIPSLDPFPGSFPGSFLGSHPWILPWIPPSVPPWIPSLDPFLDPIPGSFPGSFLGSHPWIQSLDPFPGSLPWILCWIPSLDYFPGSHPWILSWIPSLDLSLGPSWDPIPGSFPWIPSLDPIPGSFPGSHPWIPSLDPSLDPIPGSLPCVPSLDPSLDPFPPLSLFPPFPPFFPLFSLSPLFPPFPFPFPPFSFFSFPPLSPFPLSPVPPLFSLPLFPSPFSPFPFPLSPFPPLPSPSHPVPTFPPLSHFPVIFRDFPHPSQEIPKEFPPRPIPIQSQGTGPGSRTPIPGFRPHPWNFPFPTGTGMGMGTGTGTGMGMGIPLLLLLLLPMLHPAAGNVHEPLLILEGPEQGGIRLRCLSERPFSDVQLLWTDGKGENLTGIPAPTDTGSAGSSLLLRPGSGNAASCRILDPRLQTASESSVVVADVFFPATSPWLPAFLMLLVLGVFLLLAAAYKLRRNQQLLARERKNQQEIQEEIEDLKGELEEEIGKFQKGFRRAQSNAVSLTLDEHCKHPNLVIQGKSWIVTSKPGSKIHPKAVVVAREGFSEGKSYWEVEVGNGSDWELGVLGEEIRDSLRNNGGSFPEETVPGLEYSLGEFRLPGGKLERNSGSCRVLGVLLDQESRILSFFDAEEKQRLGLLPLKLPGNLFPFFSPSSDGKALGIRPVGVGGPQQ